MRCDDLFEAYIVGNNPIMASCAKAEYLCKLSREDIQTKKGQTFERARYQVKNIQETFFAFYRAYVIPTVEEYFTWVRDMYKHLVCFSKLLKIHSDGLHDFKSFAEHLSTAKLIAYLKDGFRGLEKIDEYKRAVNTKQIESALDFVMNLCPTDESRNDHLKMTLNCAELKFLRLLRDCVLDCMGQADRMDQDLSLFTRGEPYKTCFKNTGAKDLAINLVEGNLYLTIPESLQPDFTTVDSRSVKRFAVTREGLHEVLTTHELRDELFRPVNRILIFSDCCRDFFADLLENMGIHTRTSGWRHAVDYMRHRLRHSSLVQTLDNRASIDEFNYVLIERLISGPAPSVPMSDVEEDSPAAIAEKKDDPEKIPAVVAKKKEEKDPKKDNTVFIALAVFAVIMVAFANG